MVLFTRFKSLSPFYYAPNLLLLPNPFQKLFCMRPVPVQPSALTAPEKGKPGPVLRCILRTGNLFFSCHAKRCVAERAAVHHKPSLNQSAIDQLLDLLQHIIRVHQHSPLLPAVCSSVSRVSRIRPSCSAQASSSVSSFALPSSKPVRTHRIVSHEAEVPGESSQHPVGDESRFRRHDARSRSSHRSSRTAGHQGKQSGWKNPAAQ